MNLPFRFFGWILQSTGDVCAISLCLKLHLRREYESKVFFLQVLSERKSTSSISHGNSLWSGMLKAPFGDGLSLIA